MFLEIAKNKILISTLNFVFELKTNSLVLWFKYGRSRENQKSVLELINMGSLMLQKTALLVGIFLIVIGVFLLDGNWEADIFPVILGLVGLFVITVFFLSRKKKWLVPNK